LTLKTSAVIGQSWEELITNLDAALALVTVAKYKDTSICMDNKYGFGAVIVFDG